MLYETSILPRTPSSTLKSVSVPSVWWFSHPYSHTIFLFQNMLADYKLFDYKLMMNKTEVWKRYVTDISLTVTITILHFVLKL